MLGPNPRKNRRLPRLPQAGHDLAGLDVGDLVACWLLRLVLALHATRGSSRNIFRLGDEFCSLVGLPPLNDKARSQLSDAALQQLLTDRLDEVVPKLARSKQVTLYKNIRFLGRRMGLTAAEREILLFACVLASHNRFAEFLDSALELYCNAEQACHLVSIMTKLPLRQTKAALASEGILRRSGLITVGPGIQQFTAKIGFEELFADILMTRHSNTDALIGRFFKEASRPTLTASHFPHLSQQIELLVPLLGKAADAKEAGINILIHGVPGAGKTEFARLLAEMAGLSLFEVGCTDMEGQSALGIERFCAYQFCQNLLANSQRTAVLFDEFEDVFPPGGNMISWPLSGGPRQARSRGKAWVNQILETNAVPTIWISNDLGGLDPAYLRRFSVILEFPKPVRSVRAAITAQHLQGLPLSAGYIHRLAGNEAISPGHISTAARTLRIRAPEGERDSEKMLDAILDGSLRATHGDGLKRQRAADLPYRLAALNSAPPPQTLVDGLRRHHQASLCFYGPPGTGKTALGRHLAESLDRPLLVKRASDLLDKWVGGSEKNIAAMFHEAEQEGAILLLDEADSFLSDRREARQHWEITQTNELLTRMEEFDGIFICTTNLLDQLDPAALRRFDFKVCFDYCNDQQRSELFADLLSSFELPAMDAHGVAALHRLKTLTPGDFAVVARQWSKQIEPPSPLQLITSLERECVFKGEHRTGIGFINA